MKFADITGHKEAIGKLKGMVDSGKLPHALLLHGPVGVGKGRVALALLQYIYCESRTGGDSCGKCPACLQSQKLNNPDIHYVFPIVKKDKLLISADYIEEWKEFLKISPYFSQEIWLDVINAGNSRPMIHVTESEEMLRVANLSAYGSGYKAFMVWLPEKMNAEAANRLLKLIEEPFEDTLFIFISNNPGEILPTVRSRLQGVEFKALTDMEVTTSLELKGVAHDEALSAAHISAGNMNKALALVSEEGETKEFISGFISVMRGAYSRNMPELRRLADLFAGYGREKSLRLLDYFGRMVRESFISNLKTQGLTAMMPEEQAFVAKFGPFVNAANVEEISRQIDRAREDISRNANQKIVWFDFMIEITRLIRLSNPGKVPS